MRRTKSRKLKGGNSEGNTDSELSTPINLPEEDILLGLGFGDGDIEMLNEMEIPIKKIKKAYWNALLSKGEDGYGLIQLQNKDLIDIINADELNELIDTSIEKHDVANLAFHNITDQQSMEGGRKRKPKYNRTKNNKKTKSKKTKSKKTRKHRKVR